MVLRGIRASGRAHGLLALAALAAGCRAGSPPPITVDEPVRVDGKELVPAGIKRELAATFWAPVHGGEVRCAYQVLGRGSGQIHVWALCAEVARGAIVSAQSGPAAVEVDAGVDPPRIVAVRRPGDGARYRRDVEAMFPGDVLREIDADTDRHNRRVAALERAILAEVARPPGAPAP